jgi:putative hemolysin
MLRVPLKTVFISFLSGAVMLLIGACSEDTSRPVGLANPASVHCGEAGGTSKIVQTEEGAVGLCNFTDGSFCDEWAFYRGECVPDDTLKNQSRWAFSCPDGYQFTISYLVNSQQIIFEAPEDRKVLIQTRSASGARYTDGNLIFWGKGKSGHIEKNGQVIHGECQGKRM